MEENIFILLGDHGQVQLVAGEEQAGIDLEKLYADYDIHRLGEPVSESAIAFGVNGRMSYVYDVHNSEQPSRLAELALQDERIALAAWLEKDWVVTQRPGSNQVFRFSPGGPLTDIYGQRWTLRGDGHIVGVKLDQQKKNISYTDYPE
ncbi:type I phosphodiesterase/nucleotide pyrophosphatase [Caldalkalibacillus thermarum TA2.A1]|uniref:Type I phosphodiesterase/nucleotide pyrophosphatase n=1 Tax=Caldalkalibacillus thermarum (strain TA2.A1) TaxID=986075 RepID=F5L6L6_CALTT|nr:hypothetical protein [Caldalkalibacillus thermarum]EGL83023.1 type I phosphodiesterase/nucleotide pyrophosphatase [Caldalkalibacillus thermarum TA2.A1]